MRRINFILCLMVMALQLTKAADGNLQVINISPDTSMNLVAVSIEDSVIIDSLSFNEASAYITIPEGETQTLIFTSINYPTEKFELTDLTIAAGAFYQSILNGVVNPTSYAPNPEGISLDLTATWNSVDTSGIADDKLKVNFFHGISDLVELDIADFFLEYIIDNMSYGEYSSTSINFDRDERELFIVSTDRANQIASRAVDLSAITGKTLTIFFSGFIVPNDNNNGPVINYYSADEAGNVTELPFLNSTAVIDELVNNFNNYPNPANDFTYLEFNTTKLSNLEVSLFDLSGKQIQNQVFDIQNGFNRIKINLPPLATGLYFLTLNAEGSQSALPLVISQ